MNTVDTDKSTTDTAIDVDKDCRSILGKRSAPKRMKDEGKGNKIVVRNATVNALPNDCVAITIDTFRDMKVQLDEHQVTIKGLRDELSTQRDLVK